MNETLFSPGDRVVVSWMGAPVRATIYEATKKGKTGRYRLTIEGVTGHPWYEEHEMEADRELRRPS